MLSTRRSFLIGTTALLAAPAIVRVGSIMPVQSPRWVTVKISYDITHEVIVPMQLTQGEYWIPADAVRAIGDGNLIMGINRLDRLLGSRT